MLTGQTIRSQHADVFTFLNGNLERQADQCAVPEEAVCGSLVYVSTSDQLGEALQRQPAIMILSSQMAGSYSALPDADICSFSVRDVPMGMAILLKYFDNKAYRFS